MEQHWQELGGANGPLGSPDGDPFPIDGGHRWNFAGGAIFRSASAGDSPATVTAVLTPILERYDSSGGAAGALGFPLDDQRSSGSGTVQELEHGNIYHSPQTSAHAVVGAILHRYLQLGGPQRLGLPTTDERDTRGTGRTTTFQHGHIYWSSRTGTHAVVGAILHRYLQLGGPQSDLGLPTTSERAVSNGARQGFSHGRSLFWDSRRPHTFVRIRYFARARGVTARDLPYTWHEGCPVPPRNLRMVRIVHRGWNGDDTVGRMVMHRNVVNQMRDVFRRMHHAGFPVRRMDPVDVWDGDDVKAMSADNTSAFNCRHVTGNPYRLSQHSYGNAADLNTFENPYVTGSRVYPAGARTYLNRSWVRKGMITSGDVVTRGMWAHGWLWGARWSDPDYQHFSANGG